YDQARAFFDKKYYSAAGDMLKLVLDIQPDNAEALALRALINQAVAADIAGYLETAKQAEAQANRIELIESCDRILALDSTNIWAQEARIRALAGMDIEKQLNIGIDLFNKGQKAEAAKRFRSVLEARPNDVVAREYLSKIDVRVAQVASLEDLQKDREIWQIYIDGLKHMRDQQFQKAIDAWQKVLEAYPNQPNTLNNIEQARLRLKAEKSGQ
ncbi:MAG: tetratricopeptide repeat protein, partial [candidate division Zixibacteria bacterium]|nr:tetratricopeptide repeat protein [candidate division Zixibacteria bacterium]